ncbi:MAG: radical SAM protein [Acidimicrobiales bacterium]|nr:radical SAM protein [Acidimicrobiales bacterium]
MEPEQRAALDDHRDLSDKAVRAACYAPFTSMYLDPHGDVLACCQNTEHPLGNVADRSLADIWHGARAEELRTALEAYDLGRGCRFCAWQVDDGNYAATYSHSFEGIEVRSARPEWPRRLEFAVSNTCNLECVMCNGEWSSKIRSRREGRAPLRSVYGDRFFEELRPFLHHLTEARFLGGEPLLAAETLRIMDLMVEEGVEVPCHLTTNGTQWNDRVERLLDRLPVSLAVSLDGVTPETVESIRVGASHAALMENLARYRAYTTSRGTTLDLTFCFMRQNWHEFGAYLAFADEWGCRVYVNTVIHPRFSVYHLPLAEFDAMLHALEAEDATRRDQLTVNQPLWISELERLRTWSAQAAAEAQETAVGRPYRAITPRAVYFQEQEPTPLPLTLREARTGDDAPTEAQALERAAKGMPPCELSLVRCDAEDLVLSVRTGPEERGDASFVGVPSTECVGRPFPELAAGLSRRLGDHVRAVRDDVVDGVAIRHVVYRDLDGRRTYLRVCSYPLVEGDEVHGSVAAVAWTQEAPWWAALDEVL